MPGNSSGYKNTSKAMGAGAFGAPMSNPSASYNQASAGALSNSGIANNNNYSLNAGRGWTNNNGVYSNGSGSEYSYDPESGWKSLQGYTGTLSPKASPADAYRANNPDSFGPGSTGTRYDQFGINKGEWQRGLRDAGLSGDAYKMQQGYNPSTIYNANQYARQYGLPAYNAEGRALTGTGYYSGAADGINNNQMKMAMGLKLPKELERLMSDPSKIDKPWAQEAMSDWVPNDQGGWIKAPKLMDQRDMNNAAFKDALTSFGYTKPDQAGFGSALNGYGQPVLDTSGTAQNPFSGGFTTSGGQINQGILAPPTRQQIKQLYRPGGANFLGGN